MAKKVVPDEENQSTASAPAPVAEAKKNEDFFGDYKKHSLTKPRDLAWDNWAKFEKQGDKVQGYIRDVFYRPAEGLFKEQRGITLEQLDGTLINVGIKRLPFVLSKTDGLRIGDPLTVELAELKKSATKGFHDTKIFAFYGKNVVTEGQTVAELEAEDKAKGGSTAPLDLDAKPENGDDDVPFD